MPGPPASKTAPTPPAPAVQGTSGSPLRVTIRAVALALLLAAATVFGVTHMDQAIDTWISLAGGRDIAAHGVRDADPFSFQSRLPYPPTADAVTRIGHWLHPNGWINQNWLTHLLFYRLRQLGGLDALVIWKLFNYLAVALVLVAAGRALEAPWTWSALAAGGALVASRSYLSMRAQDVSNLIVAALVLVLVLTYRRSSRWAWALVPLFAIWANAHGGFVYGFVILAVVIVPEAFQTRKPGALGPEDRRRLITLGLASAASLVASAAASPYRLANLTHPLVITISPDAPQWRVVREWRPLFSNPVASPVPFVVFALVAVAAMVAAFRLGAPAASDRAAAMGMRVALASIALAVSSGRFVPVACVAAAPFLALWLDGCGRAVERMAGVEDGARRFLATLGVDVALWLVTVVALGALVPRVERTYFAAWPQDDERTGLFDRMTFSHQRPWGPCAFLAANEVTGRMWNFWDEGGFLASCQQPDAASGRVPVQIFIDGRAQAAYDVGALKSYLDLLNGNGLMPQRGPDGAPANDLGVLRSWTAGRLRELGVWIALVPAAYQGTAVARAVVGLPGWRLVYIDPQQSMFVDTGNPAGQALSDRVGAGSARFPSEAAARLTAAFRLLPAVSEGEQERAVALAREAYAAQPSNLAVLCAVRAARSPEARAAALEFCRTAAEEFIANRHRLRDANGYAPRLDAAATALQFLGAEASRNNQDEVVRRVAAQLASCRAEQQQVIDTALW
jgi:hypothetical protein